MQPTSLPVDEAGTPCPDDRDKQHLMFVARRALQESVDPTMGGPLRVEGHLKTLPLFVTLWTARGQLRGCVGHVFARCATLEEELAECAQAAALSDTRFEPLRHADLNGLTLDVTLMGPLQPVDDERALDPHRYGVLVEGSLGRRGVLLPNVAGVDSVATQVQVARRKAGIDDDEPVTLRRFAVCKFGEDDVREPAGSR